jgi:TrmH family RNA methyltransferase
LDSNFELEHLYSTQNDFEAVSTSKKSLMTLDLKKISALANRICLAVFKIPLRKNRCVGFDCCFRFHSRSRQFGDDIECDWFGVTEIVCSKETVDLYNPKVVQATMGSIARVNVSYVDLNSLSSTDLPVFGTFMDGVNIYKTTLPQEGVGHGQ